MPYPYIVRAVNVNDKVLVKPLMKKASRLLRLYGKCISYFIAESQYYPEEVFKEIRRYGAIHTPLLKGVFNKLYVTKRFRVEGGEGIVELYEGDGF
jgi:hypothetical protein